MERPLQIWVMEDFSAHPGLIEGVLARGFNAKHLECPALSIRVLSWSRVWSSLMTSLKSDERPDIIQIGSTWLRPLIHLGWLRPWPKESEVDLAWELDPVARTLGDSSWVDGYRYGVPWLVDIRLLYQRVDPKAGSADLPQSFHDWVRSMNSERPWLVSSGMEPGLVQLLAMWLWSSGCELLPDNGKFRNAWEPALMQFYELGQRKAIVGQSDMGAVEASDRFFGPENLGSHLITRPWVLPVSGRVQATAIPPAVDHSANIFVGGSYLAIIAQESLHPSAFAAVSALCSPEAESVLAESTGYWPATDGVVVPNLRSKVPRGVLDAVAARGRGLPNIPHWRYLERLFERSANALLNLAYADAPWVQWNEVIRRLEDDVAEVEAVTNL